MQSLCHVALRNLTPRRQQPSLNSKRPQAISSPCRPCYPQPRRLHRCRRMLQCQSGSAPRPLPTLAACGTCMGKSAEDVSLRSR